MKFTYLIEFNNLLVVKSEKLTIEKF